MEGFGPWSPDVMSGAFLLMMAVAMFALGFNGAVLRPSYDAEQLLKILNATATNATTLDIGE